MNPLTDILPAKWRGYVYTTYALVGVSLGGCQVGYVAGGDATPDWLTRALAVFAYVGVAIGATAAANVPAPTPDDSMED